MITTSVRRYYLGLGNERNSLGDPFEAPDLEEIAASVEENDATEMTATKQLEAILNSRAWHWVARYGRVKTRLTRVLGDKH